MTTRKTSAKKADPVTAKKSVPSAKPAPAQKPAPTPVKKAAAAKKTVDSAKPASAKKPEPAPAKKPAATKKTAPAKKPAAPVKAASAKKPAPAPVKKAATAKKTAAPAKPAPADHEIWRLKVLCVAGPYWDGSDTCIRTIDVRDDCSLYDLHTAILESVHFEEHDESVFTYFTAVNYRGRRTYLADGQSLTPQTDTEPFEDLLLADALPDGPGRFLYYVFDAQDPWVFLVGREPGARAPSVHEFYPFVRDELNDGADPVQHGDGLDDFADADEGEEFNDLRERFRQQRRAREESGLGDEPFDPMEDDGDEDEGGEDIRGFDDVRSFDDDPFLDDDDRESRRDPYDGGFGDDDW